MRPPLGLIRLERARSDALNDVDKDHLKVFIKIASLNDFTQMMLEDIVEVTLALSTASSDPRECVIQHLQDVFVLHCVTADQLMESVLLDEGYG